MLETKKIEILGHPSRDSSDLLNDIHHTPYGKWFEENWASHKFFEFLFLSKVSFKMVEHQRNRCRLPYHFNAIF